MTHVEYFRLELEALKLNDPNSFLIPYLEKFSELFNLADQKHITNQVADSLSDKFKKLIRFESISPITGSENEWEKVIDLSEEGKIYFQNKRCPGLFWEKTENKIRYNSAVRLKTIHGQEFFGPFYLNALDCKNRDFSKRLNCALQVKQFPFEPETFKLTVIEDLNGFFLLDDTELEKVKEKYVLSN